MLVVADSSPINILVRIESVHILPVLFGSIVIPPQVRDELLDAATPDVVKQFVRLNEPWLIVRSPKMVTPIPPLDRGEEAAINLAQEIEADALLIDERDGRRAAAARGLSVVGTLGVLERAAERGVIKLPDVLHRLLATDFRLDRKLVDAAIARAHRRQDGNEEQG